MQPSYCFQGCHPYSRVSPGLLRPCDAFTSQEARRQGSSVAVSRQREYLTHAIAVGGPSVRSPIDLPART